MIRHHLDPDASYSSWKRSDANLPDIDWLKKTDFIVTQDMREMKRYQSKSDIEAQQLSDRQVSAIKLFLQALTGYSVRNPPLGVPERVPSGLAVDQ